MQMSCKFGVSHSLWRRSEISQAPARRQRMGPACARSRGAISARRVRANASEQARTRGKRRGVEIGHFSQKCTRCVWCAVAHNCDDYWRGGDVGGGGTRAPRYIYNVMNEHSAGVVLGVAHSARGRRRCCLHARSARRRRKRRKQQLANCDRFFARLLFPSSANISACAALLL
jgi:hypothetical protein